MLRFVVDGLLHDGRGDAVRFKAVGVLEGGHGLGDVHVVDAVDGPAVQLQRLQIPLQRPHGGAAAAVVEGDVHGGGGGGVGDGLLELAGGQAGLLLAQQALGFADGAHGGQRILLVDFLVVDAQRLQLQLQIPHLAAGAAPAQHAGLVGHAQELAVGLAAGGVIGGLEEQVAKLLVPLAVLVDVHPGAHGAVLGDEPRVLRAHADAAVGNGISEIPDGLLVDGALVGPVVQQGMEHHVVVDAGGVAGIAAEGPEVKPFLPLAVPLLVGHFEAAQGGGVLRAGGAEPLHHDRAAVLVFIDGDDLVDDVHIHPVRGGLLRRRAAKWSKRAQQERQYQAVQCKPPCFHGKYCSLMIDINIISHHYVYSVDES